MGTKNLHDKMINAASAAASAFDAGGFGVAMQVLASHEWNEVSFEAP